MFRLHARRNFFSAESYERKPASSSTHFRIWACLRFHLPLWRATFKVTYVQKDGFRQGRNTYIPTWILQDPAKALSCRRKLSIHFFHYERNLPRIDWSETKLATAAPWLIMHLGSTDGWRAISNVRKMSTMKLKMKKIDFRRWSENMEWIVEIFQANKKFRKKHKLTFSVEKFWWQKFSKFLCRTRIREQSITWIFFGKRR
jgi:hypothetical protein